LHLALCVCALLPRLETRTRVVLVVHRDEARKSTNSGRWAAACLVNSEALVRGDEARPGPPLTWPPGARALLLFPHHDAAPLAPPPDGRPVTLVVPDGTWRQAAKVRARVPGLAGVPCVTLPPGPPPRHRLRGETRPGGLPTFEAIARALGVLEGEPVRRALEAAFDAVAGRTLWARGRLDASDVAGGIPEAARRHGPAPGAGGAAGD
jgi:DTW domain-containing protein YfiP